MSELAPEPDLRALLERGRAGAATPLRRSSAADDAVDAVLAGLAQLELRGLVRRDAGGRYARTRVRRCRHARDAPVERRGHALTCAP